MLVASDTSPICNLAIIGRLQLLRSQFGEVWIPDAVKRELERLHHADLILLLDERDGLRVTGVLGFPMLADAGCAPALVICPATTTYGIAV